MDYMLRVSYTELLNAISQSEKKLLKEILNL
jgi:hypothetical protein